MAVTPAVIQPSDNSGDAIPLLDSSSNGRNNLATFRNGLVVPMSLPGTGSTTIRSGVLGRQASAVAGANGFNDFRAHAPTVANGLQFNVEPASAIIASTTSADGGYLVHSRKVQSLTLDPANTSNPRYDILYLAQRDKSAGAADTTTYLGVVTGTPGATPVIPSAPTGTGLQLIGLWLMLVPANATNFSQVVLTDIRNGTSINGLPRPRLGADIAAGAADVGYVPGEKRVRAGGTGLPNIMRDVWGYDGAWHGDHGFTVNNPSWANGTSSITITTSETAVQTLTVPDPGWNYKLKVYGQIYWNSYGAFTAGSPQSVTINVRQTNTSGTLLASAIGYAGRAANDKAAFSAVTNAPSPTFSGAQTFVMTGTGSVSVAAPFTAVAAQSTMFYVDVVPA